MVFYISLGILGFLIIHLFDLFTLRRVPVAKPLTWVLGVGSVVYSLIKLCLTQEKLPLPTWLSWPGWALFIISLFMVTYSLFINLPLRKTYITSGVSSKLITTGLYALVRHPGVPSLTLLMFALITLSRSTLLLVAVPIFIVLDVILVMMQEKLVLVRMLDGYKQYQRDTPMLVPNHKSINAFTNCLRQDRKPEVWV